MKNYKPYIIIILLVPVMGYAQNLEELGVAKGIKVNGSLNLSAVGYLAQGIEQRRDPLDWFATGNLTINFFGYSTPFSFSYSNTNRSFSQPFNQFSFTPQYKWIKTYIGYNSMTFSNYTLAGHVFLGGGVELTPNKWRIAAMYGRLRKAVPFNLSDTLQYTDASFQRMGYGIKIGYEDNGNLVSVNIFSAKDDLTSIPFIFPESQLTPQQNVAISLTFRKKFLKRFFVESEYALSALNRDTRANANIEVDSTHISSSNIIKGLLPENTTSRYYDALNASFGYQGNWYSLRLKYERIAPEYTTLGAYYFNNDMRNITIVPSVRLFQNTMNLSGNVGIQENNLDNTRASTTKRFVGSINASYVPGEKWNFAMNYSNFSSYTNMRPRTDPFFRNNLDTLNFYQVSRTTNATVVRNLGSKQNPQSIMLTTSYQRANDRASYEGGSQQSDFVTMNISYSYSIIPANTTIAVAANAYTNDAAGIKSTYLGPTMSVTKSFLEKTLRGSLATTYNETIGSNIETSPVLNNRVNITYTPRQAESKSAGQHNFAIGLNVLNKLKAAQQQPAFTEFTGTVNYTYSF